MCCSGRGGSSVCGMTGRASGAAEYGHLEVQQWARQHDCPWDFQTRRRAEESGHQEVFRWLDEHGAPSGYRCSTSRPDAALCASDALSAAPRLLGRCIPPLMRLTLAHTVGSQSIYDENYSLSRTQARTHFPCFSPPRRDTWRRGTWCPRPPHTLSPIIEAPLGWSRITLTWPRHRHRHRHVVSTSSAALRPAVSSNRFASAGT
jgi:hypothetical protein